MRGEATNPGHWILGTFVGWSCGFVLSILSLVVAESVGLRETQFPLALGMGAGVGFAQARMLRPYLGRRRTWTLATSLGLALPFMVRDAAYALGGSLPYSLAAYVALGGLSAGLFQAFVARAFAPRAWSWVVVSLLGWTLGGSTVAISDQLLPKTAGLLGALQYVGVILAGGGVLGAVGATAPGAVIPARSTRAATTDTSNV